MPFVIGIAGGSASGKSTLAGILEQRLADLRLAVMHMDDYFKSDDERPVAAGPVNGKRYLDDNHPQSLDLPKFAADLAALKAEPYDVIIAEGLMVLWDDAICDMVDLKLFVDCRSDERIVRRLRRNMAWGLSFDEIADVYVDLVRFRHDEYVENSKWRADLIINGSKQSEQAIDMIEAAARAAAQAQEL